MLFLKVELIINSCLEHNGQTCPSIVKSSGMEKHIPCEWPCKIQFSIHIFLFLSDTVSAFKSTIQNFKCLLNPRP